MVWTLLMTSFRIHTGLTRRVFAESSRRNEIAARAEHRSRDLDVIVEIP